MYVRVFIYKIPAWYIVTVQQMEVVAATAGFYFHFLSSVIEDWIL